MYPFFSYVASYLLIKFGLYKTNTIGVLMMTLGAAFRVFLNHNFNFYLVGTLLAGAAKPIIFNT
jgi:cyanate permease